MNRLTLRGKLVVAFATIAVLVLAAAGLGLLAQRRAQADFDAFAHGITHRSKLINEVIGAVDARAIAARNLVLVTDPADTAAEKQAVETAHQRVATTMKQLREAAQTAGDGGEDTRLLVAMEQVEARYAPVALSIVGNAVRGDKAAAVAQMNKECRPLLAELLQRAGDYLTYNAKLTDQTVAEVDRAAQRTTVLLAVLTIAALLAATGLAVMIPRGVLRSLGAEPTALSEAVGRIRDGDLGPVVGAEQAPPGSVLASLAAMRSSLAHLVAQVRNASENIASASTQIAQGNLDLSGRTEQQASALQQTAATMEEVGATVRNTADNAKQANQLAQGASTIATQGGEVVGQVVDTMKGINDSSKKIADIIAVIDGIAFQTNILALNAAVEAARAGEQGRGFAVVASEVRSLAQRSADAAKEIKTLITASVERVEQGTELVDRAGQTMSEIVGSIRRVTDIVGEITSASIEQSSGVSQVGEAVGQLDRTTQQNAALVEESAAAAESLKHQAAQLVRAVAAFRIDTAGAAAPPRPATQPASSRAEGVTAVAPHPGERRPGDKAATEHRSQGGGRATAAATPTSRPAPAAAATAGQDDWESF